MKFAPFLAMPILWSLLLSAPPLLGAAPVYPDEGDGEELRLHLPDPTQERRTTSLNWADLGVSAEEKRTAQVETPKPAQEFKKLLIVIDAGHGGKDYGALSYYGLQEKKLCLSLARLVNVQLKRAFKRRGIPVDILLSRDTDIFIPLRERVKIANDSGADLFVSIHANSSESMKARGFEVYFLSPEASDARARSLARIENEEHGEAPINSEVMSILSDLQATHHVAESSQFAETVFRAMSRQLKANGRGVRQGPFTVLAGTTMPALLVEVGFLTNPEEAKALTKPSYLKRLSNAISSGIIEFASVLRRVAS